MRLITIGRSKSSTIYINNEYVSSNHATILLLDNGDIFLTDCDSLHGTYLFGKKINPNTEVPIKRGDKIDFDKVPLNWAQVPNIPIPDPSVVKGVYGVGKSPRNRYQLSGDSVSRYHATFKEMKNGQWFITDHSTNGTYVNGQRIPSNTEYRIKANDSIMCGNVPCTNPVPSRSMGNILKYASFSAAAVAAIVAIILIIPKIIGQNIDPAKATVLVRNDYNLKVVFKNKAAVRDLFGVEEFYIKEQANNDGRSYIYLYTSVEDATTYSSYGTAFFVSDDGTMLTNKHVVNASWADNIYSRGEEMKQYRYAVKEALKGLKPIEDVSVVVEDFLSSEFDIVASNQRLSVRYSGRAYTSSSEFDWAHILAQSSDDKIDVAVIRLNDKKTPEYADYFNLKRFVPISQLKRDETYFSVGYPAAIGPAYSIDENTLRLSYSNFHLAQDPGKYQLIFQGDPSKGGQSGSAIYDSKNRLVGVLWGGYRSTETTGACPIIHAIDLLKDVIEERKAMGDYYETNKQ